MSNLASMLGDFIFFPFITHRTFFPLYMQLTTIFPLFGVQFCKFYRIITIRIQNNFRIPKVSLIFPLWSQTLHPTPGSGSFIL